MQQDSFNLKLRAMVPRYFFNHRTQDIIGVREWAHAMLRCQIVILKILSTIKTKFLLFGLGEWVPK